MTGRCEICAGHLVALVQAADETVYLCAECLADGIHLGLIEDGAQ